MGAIRVPRSLRAYGVISTADRTLAAQAACLFAVGSAGSAEAQQAQSALPPVTIDAPVAKKKPIVTTPSPAQKRARAALRRRTKELQNQQAAAAPGGASSYLFSRSAPVPIHMPIRRRHTRSIASRRANSLSRC